MESVKSGYSIEYLSGDIKIYQRDGLYKFTSDSILLSRFAAAKKSDKVADFCAGSGVVGFNFYALNPAVKSMTFFELQKELSDLSNKSIELNNLDNFKAVNCRLQDIPKEYNGSFSLVLCNPPYEKSGSGIKKFDYHTAVCRSEIEIDLKSIIAAAARVLKFGGRLAILNRADRVAEVIGLMLEKNIQPKKLQFVKSAANKEPYLLMIEGVLGGKSGCKVLNEIINGNFGEV